MCPTTLQATPGAEKDAVRVVCVEAAWCDIAAQIGNGKVKAQALLVAPGIDPHELEPTPMMARALADADLVIINGATYDEWAEPLVSPHHDHMTVADIAGWKPGDDAHLVLDLHAVRLMVQALTRALTQLSPTDEVRFAEGRLHVLKALQHIEQRLERLKAAHEGAAYATVETQGMALLKQAGLRAVDSDYARSVARHTTPSPQEEAALETALRTRGVSMIVINPAIQAPQFEHLVAMAKEGSIPVIGIGETLPPGMSWQGWVNGILDHAQNALNTSVR